MTRLQLVEGTNPKTVEKEIEQEMDKEVKHFEKEVAKIRTGRANTALLEDIKVAVYGTTMSLRELGVLSAPDVQMLVIQPWDKSIIPDIEKAISLSDLGVSPTNDGNVIRIVLPRMSGARREELIKVLHKKLEECKVAIRTTRKNFQNIIRDSEKDKKISEDFAKRLTDLLQKITDKFIELSEKISQKKEEEIRAL